MNNVFCTKCGAELGANSKFCVKCGAALESSGQDTAVTVNSEPSPANSGDFIKSIMQDRNKLIKVAVAFAAVIIAVVVILNMGGGNRYINAVREGSFDAYPNITIGRAFERFYDNPSWSHFENSRGDNIVRFSGEWTAFGVTSRYEWDFNVGNNNRWELVAIRENGIPQVLIWAESWLAIVFDNQ